MASLHGEEASFGAIEIDWANCKVLFHGMDGTDMPADAVLALAVAAKDKPGVEFMPMIFWHEQGQLSVHDLGGFAVALDEDDDEGDD